MEQTPKYRYHIHLLIYDNYTNFYHSFNSDNEVLRMSEIRSELKKQQNDAEYFLIANISKTIND